MGPCSGSSGHHADASDTLDEVPPFQSVHSSSFSKSKPHRSLDARGKSHIPAMYYNPGFLSTSVADTTPDPGTMNGHEVLLVNLQSLQPSCLLILIMTGKVIMNIFIFGARHKNVSASFMGYCCISLAIVDFVLFFAISAIHCFQDFTIVGLRFTSYHICLFTQIISHTYGILHLPFFLASGLDNYLTVVKSLHIPCGCSGLLYIACVLLLWSGAFAYVLLSPVGPPEVGTEQSTDQCDFYTSCQSFYMSISLVCIICIMLTLCCSEIGTFLKSLKVISYRKNTAIVFSFLLGDRWPVQGGKRLIAALLFSFLGTWSPFVVLQIIILFLCAHIPGYMDMNVPWLYFLNSFLIAVSFGLKNPDLQITEKTFYRDPFISWKYCVLPFMQADNKAVSTERGAHSSYKCRILKEATSQAMTV
ncbi:probable G-protein coupled receptor 160 isoform X2 [Bufo bufo]|uniref:probable G-protein coupled receptor 160 isoform X2 n=1 Tax=Bufo bufo TaxID=8384 RepID=UPI001ABDE867|nr:probable G-protein coupled receptor 160 isoform X2 [Bufo bufo]